MAVLEKLLPYETDFGFTTDRPGPIAAAEFEAWTQDDDNPLELIEGWLMPMSPGTHRSGRRALALAHVLYPLLQARGWDGSMDSLHRLPSPPETVVYPDFAIHCVAEVEIQPDSETVTRVPDLVVEFLSPKTAQRDRAPHGAKFLAYQMSGVREYYYSWPDGRDAAGFRLEEGLYVPIGPDADGFFPSPLLEARLRLVPAALVE